MRCIIYRIIIPLDSFSIALISTRCSSALRAFSHLSLGLTALAYIKTSHLFEFIRDVDMYLKVGGGGGGA